MNNMNNKHNFYKILKKETFKDNDYKWYNGFQIPLSLKRRILVKSLKII